VVQESTQPALDELVPDLAFVREAGLEPLEIEGLLQKLQALPGLGIVRRRTRVGTEHGRVEFLDYDEPFTLKAPPASQTIDISKLRTR
jgi:hypothetical protein